MVADWPPSSCRYSLCAPVPLVRQDKPGLSHYLKGGSYVNCLFDIKLRSVVLSVTMHGERDRSASAGEGGGTPSDSAEASRNSREHRKGLVTHTAVISLPKMVKSETVGVETSMCTPQAARGNR